MISTNLNPIFASVFTEQLTVGTSDFLPLKALKNLENPRWDWNNVVEPVKDLSVGIQ